MYCPLAEMGWGANGIEASTRRARVPGKGGGAAMWSCPTDLHSQHRSIIPGTEGDGSGHQRSCRLCPLSVVSATISLSSTLNACHFRGVNTIPPVPELTGWIVAAVEILFCFSVDPNTKNRGCCPRGPRGHCSPFSWQLSNKLPFQWRSSPDLSAPSHLEFSINTHHFKQ